MAVGTGDARYARAFATEESIPFLVLVDDEAKAATAASVGRARLVDIAGPGTWLPAARSLAAGHRQHRSGVRQMQLGATLVIGPGDQVLYQHFDADVADHAPEAEIMAAIGARPPVDG